MKEIEAFGDGGCVVGHLVTDEALNAIVGDRRGADRKQAGEDETQDRGCGADLLAHGEAVLEGAQLALQLSGQRRLQGSPVASPAMLMRQRRFKPRFTQCGSAEICRARLTIG
jgi:hypothetical protein